MREDLKTFRILRIIKIIITDEIFNRDDYNISYYSLKFDKNNNNKTILK